MHHHNILKSKKPEFVFLLISLSKFNKNLQVVQLFLCGNHEFRSLHNGVQSRYKIQKHLLDVGQFEGPITVK